MRLLLSYFSKVQEQFLVVEKMMGNDLEQQALLLSAYREKNLNRHFQKALKRSEKELNKQTFRHPKYHFSNFKLEQEKLLFQAKSRRTRALNLQNLEDNLDHAFLSMKLRQACTSLSHQAVFNTQYHITLMAEILEKVRQPHFINIPAITVYYHCYLALFEANNEAHFQNFKQVLFENTGRFPKEEMRSLYLLVINFCIKKINANQYIYLREALDLYKKGLEEEILLEDQKLSRFSYNNMVGISLRLGDFHWAAWFVETYKNNLDASYREVTYSLSSARLEFERKNFNRALSHLQKSDYNNLINSILAKILLLKIYYETKETDLLFSHLKTMQMFIRRNKKTGYHYENWGNIIRYTQRLMELNLFDKKAVEELQELIQKEAILTEKRWLLGQL
ncbi:MAG: hypothetical protein ACI9LN_003170 [Saprospiraceae bacterium]|jgi:hypothetical protein